MIDIHSKSYSIMLIDDSLEDLVLLKRILLKHSFKVTTCSSGIEALRLAEEDPPDIFLLDVHMPVMNGFEVCQIIQKNEKLKFIPVVFLSALTNPLDKVQGFDVGGVDFISKPFQFDEVFARINTHLRIHSLINAQYRQIEKNYINLKELELLRDNLVHMIIHDMRTPLSVVSGNLLLMKKDFEKQPPHEKMMRRLLDAVQSTETLIGMANNILDVSKMESGRIDLNKSRFDLKEAVFSAVAKSYLPGEMAKFIQKLPDFPVMIEGDQEYIERVIQNLLSNSFKFTSQKKGLVQLSVEQGEQFVRLSVQDNGPGIPVEIKDIVFNKFVIGDSKTKGARHSIGLGLPFSKMAIEAHQGTISADNLESGGAIFWFDLPLGK